MKLTADLIECVSQECATCLHGVVHKHNGKFIFTLFRHCTIVTMTISAPKIKCDI
jgi:hypothetical protein